ncbi:MAG: hypothetical protein ABJQ29_08140 [Luteolibacter sp.]
MRFHRIEPNTHYRTLRLLSEGGKWELGMSPYSHGMRMRMGFAGRPPRVIDFCMGCDACLFPEVLTAILRCLDPLSENITDDGIDAVFPWHGTRPDMAVHLGELLGTRVASSTV